MHGHDHRRERRRSLSPREHKQRHSHSYRERSPHHRDERKLDLPYKQKPLSKDDLRSYINLFGQYLDVQKQLDIAKLDEREVKGRWKSFIKKWNAGELAQGWYDPERRTRALPRIEDRTTTSRPRKHSRDAGSSDEEVYGPSSTRVSTRQGPAVPSLQDLQYRRELDHDQRQAQSEQQKYDRKVERKLQEERLNELAPRADPGTIERKREKRQETMSANRAFADAKDSGAVEIPDSDLMGDDGVEAYRAKMRAQERLKNEKELRKEEVFRARAAEREVKLAEHRAKEEKTMETLRALAQQRYG